MITVNIDKAKTIAHDVRRAARAEEFKPLDVQATIPVFAKEAEEQRQLVRDKYFDMQVAIDDASSVEEIKTALGVEQ